jgi:hypothetical protein
MYLRPIEWYYSRADVIWPVSPFKSFSILSHFFFKFVSTGFCWSPRGKEWAGRCRAQGSASSSSKSITRIYRTSLREYKPKTSFSMTENECFGLVFAKTGSTNSATVLQFALIKECFLPLVISITWHSNYNFRSQLIYLKQVDSYYFRIPDMYFLVCL